MERHPGSDASSTVAEASRASHDLRRPPPRRAGILPLPISPPPAAGDPPFPSPTPDARAAASSAAGCLGGRGRPSRSAGVRHRGPRSVVVFSRHAAPSLRRHPPAARLPEAVARPGPRRGGGSIPAASALMIRAEVATLSLASEPSTRRDRGGGLRAAARGPPGRRRRLSRCSSAKCRGCERGFTRVRVLVVAVLPVRHRQQPRRLPRPEPDPPARPRTVAVR
jgi:hypothetical protein